MSGELSQPPIMDYEGSAWRTEFWRGREYEDRVDRCAVQALLPPSGARLVEIGAGFGRLADLYRGYQQVILLDYARSMLKDARARLGSDPRFVFVTADIYRLPFADGALDTALTVRVLHHIADIPRAFGEVARILRPQGTYITDFANKRHLKARVRHYLRRLGQNGRDDAFAPPSVRPSHNDKHYASERVADDPASPDSLAPYEFVPLNFDYHPGYISHNLDRVGLPVRETRAVSTFRVGALKRLVPTGLLVSLDRALQQATAPLQLSPSIFVRASSNKPGLPALNPALWRCIHCSSENITAQENLLRCGSCGARFEQVEGIWELR